MTTPTSARVGRNDPCPCGSGRKYKACHLEADAAASSAQREAERRAAIEAEEKKGPPLAWGHYHPLTHKVPAVRRPDFLVTVRNLSVTGEGARLRIHEPLDLGRNQENVDEAIAYLRDNGVEPDFWLDPPPAVITATQALLDRVLGRGVCSVVPSGYRLRRYGTTDIVADEAGGFRVYLSGRDSMAGVVRALYLAVWKDARALGIDDIALSQAWCRARVAREIVVNLLALPVALSSRREDLVTAMIRLFSDVVDHIQLGIGDGDLVEALVALPYLIGLREARREPRLALEGMGLAGSSLEAVTAQLESAAAGPAWLLRLADLAGDDWDTPDGYRGWRVAAESIDEVHPWLEAAKPSTEPAPAEALAVGAFPPAAAAESDRQPGDDAARRHQPAVPELAAPEQESAFAAVDAVAKAHAVRRSGVDEQLRAVVDRRAAAARTRRALIEQLEATERDDAEAAADEGRITDALNALADAEAAERGRAVIAALAGGSAAMDASAATWSGTSDQGADRDHASLAAVERTIGDFDAMERGGLLAQLPAAVRERLTAEADAARATLHSMLGGRDPIRVPVVVTASAEPNLLMQIALPFAGRSELAPGSLHTSLALAIAGVVAETVEAVKESLLDEVEHETLRDGVSIVRLRFASPPTVPADECAQFLAESLNDLGRANASLREAGVSIEARVEPELETGGD